MKQSVDGSVLFFQGDFYQPLAQWNRAGLAVNLAKTPPAFQFGVHGHFGVQQLGDAAVVPGGPGGGLELFQIFLDELDRHLQVDFGGLPAVFGFLHLQSGGQTDAFRDEKGFLQFSRQRPGE